MSEFGEQIFGGDGRQSEKRHLQNESRRDNTGRGSAKESANNSARSSAKGGAVLRNGGNHDRYGAPKRELNRLRSDLARRKNGENARRNYNACKVDCNSRARAEANTG